MLHWMPPYTYVSGNFAYPHTILKFLYGYERYSFLLCLGNFRLNCPPLNNFNIWFSKFFMSQKSYNFLTYNALKGKFLPKTIVVLRQKRISNKIYFSTMFNLSENLTDGAKRCSVFVHIKGFSNGWGAKLLEAYVQIDFQSNIGPKWKEFFLTRFCVLAQNIVAVRWEVFW